MSRLFRLAFVFKFFIFTVPGGQPIGVLFELIMGSKSGGFGMVSHLTPPATLLQFLKFLRSSG
jgi:hypothetical protein